MREYLGFEVYIGNFAELLFSFSLVFVCLVMVRNMKDNDGRVCGFALHELHNTEDVM